MKICFFYEGLRPGGVEHMAANFSYEFAKRGHSMTFVLAASPTPKDYVLHPSSKVLWLNKENASARSSIKELTQHLKENDYDIVLSAMPQFNNAAIVARILSGSRAKNVITERTNPHADYAQEKSMLRRLWHRSCMLFYRFAHARIAVSAGLADALAHFARLPRTGINVIYNPAYEPTEYSVDELRGKAHPWVVDGKGPVLVLAGRFAIQKDFSTFLYALKRVRETLQVRAIILGDGPLRAELEEQARQLGVADAISMPGFYEDIRPTLRLSGFFVLSSRWEGFGNVLVEALGAGCSIVSTDCPNGPSEILAQGKFGQLVPVGNSELMAEAILEMLRQPSNFDTQVSRAKEFSVEIAADNYEIIFSRVAS